jgi:hypothetical protein
MNGGVEDFGAALRRYRQEAGLSLAELAARVHYTKGHLSKIENGLKSASPALARRCDAELGAGGNLAALVPAPGGRSVGSGGGIDGDGAIWSLTLGPGGLAGFHPTAAAWAAERRADAGIEAGAGLDLGVNAGTGGGAAVWPAGRLPCAEPDDAYAGFRAAYDLARDLGQATGPGLLLPILITQAHAVGRIAAAASGAAGRRLTLLAAHFAQHTGWMALEAGNDGAAMWWTDRAAAVAAEAGELQMSAYASVRRALVALYQEDATNTIEFARRARESPAAGARVAGLAALREAQGQALAADYDACRHALDRASESLNAAQSPGAAQSSGTAEPADERQPSVGSRHVADLRAMVEGWCLVDLGRAKAAVAVLGREVERLPPGAHRTRARFGARLALAHAAAGDVDQACALAGGVLDDAALVDSATVRVELRHLRRTLTRWTSHRSVQDVLPRLTKALRAPSDPSPGPGPRP